MGKENGFDQDKEKPHPFTMGFSLPDLGVYSDSGVQIRTSINIQNPVLDRQRLALWSVSAGGRADPHDWLYLILIYYKV